MVLPGKRLFPLNTFFKDLRKKVCEACTFIKLFRKFAQREGLYAPNIPQNSGIFAKLKKYNPHTHTG